MSISLTTIPGLMEDSLSALKDPENSSECDLSMARSKLGDYERALGLESRESEDEVRINAVVAAAAGAFAGALPVKLFGEDYAKVSLDASVSFSNL
jgi:hypothetical protein